MVRACPGDAFVAKVAALSVILCAAIGITLAHARENAAGLTVQTGAYGPANAVTISRDASLTCAQGPVAIDGDGRLGYLVPVVGPSVLRGSRDLGQTIYYRVVAMDELTDDLRSSITVCKSGH